jgi:hypothetical protein
MGSEETLVNFRPAGGGATLLEDEGGFATSFEDEFEWSTISTPAVVTTTAAAAAMPAVNHVRCCC